MATGEGLSESLKCCSDQRMLIKRAVLEQSCSISCQKCADLVSTIKDLGDLFSAQHCAGEFPGEGNGLGNPKAT